MAIHISDEMVEAAAKAVAKFLDERFPEDALPGCKQLFAADDLDADFKHEAGCEALARAALEAAISTVQATEERPPTTGLPITNHEEAKEYAQIHSNHSNLARCYLSLVSRPAGQAAIPDKLGEQGWLIENTNTSLNGRVSWVCVAPKDQRHSDYPYTAAFRFTQDHLQALRFARKEDADALRDNCFPGEHIKSISHGWYDYTDDAAAPKPPHPSPADARDAVMDEHIGWLKQFVLGMDASNWRDMKLRLERQLEQFDRSLTTRGSEEKK